MGCQNKCETTSLPYLVLCSKILMQCYVVNTTFILPRVLGTQEYQVSAFFKQVCFSGQAERRPGQKVLSAWRVVPWGVEATRVRLDFFWGQEAVFNLAKLQQARRCGRWCAGMGGGRHRIWGYELLRSWFFTFKYVNRAFFHFKKKATL